MALRPALPSPLTLLAAARQISAVMDKFETQFQDLDVRAGLMEGAMGAAVSSSMPEDQIDRLMQQVRRTALRRRRGTAETG